ncbi:MAG: DNA internalization-related competence protein ComEC/Rec2 [Lachnospiraceae bacterium]|nr:DNA internalization-related competence protein ComEC/Rec2 [Lachnospiraceae bacterium]
MKRPLCFYCLLFLLLLRIVLALSGPPSGGWEKYTGSTVTISGRVEKKEIRNGNRIFYLNGTAVSSAGSQKKTDTGIVCYLEEGVLPPLGAQVCISAKPGAFRKATNPGEFDMYSYYLYQGYGARAYISGYELASGSYSRFREGLWNLRNYMSGIYGSILPDEEAGVLRAMVLGDKSELSGDIKELYRVNGISHILAISGLHISILGMGLYKALRKSGLPISISALVAIPFMAVYAMLTGAGTSTVRAVTMFGIVVAADIERRSYDLPTALAVSAAGTALYQPYLIMTSSFALSYLAVAGVAVYYPAMMRDTENGSGLGAAFFKSFTASLCVSMFTMPLIELFYYELPLYSVLLNLLVIPLMSVLMVCGLIALTAGCFLLKAGIVLALPCHYILMLYETLCLKLASLPWHSIITGAPAGWQVAAAYALFIAVIPVRKGLVIRAGKKAGGRRLKQKEAAALRIVFSLAAVLILNLRIRPESKFTMLDVGQGDGICLQTGRTTLMIDGGSTSKDALYDYQLSPFLKYSGISYIDRWFLSHPDRDHISGLTDMLADPGRNIGIGSIVLPAAAGAAEDFSEIITAAKAQGIRIEYMAAGDELGYGDLKIRSLHPAKGYKCEDVNEYSQILLVEYKDFSGVFTGDATVESEAAVMKAYPRGIDADVLKLGHHGSHTSNSEEWLELVSPESVLISCGYKNSYGHPHEEVMERVEALGCRVYRTDHDGAVTAVIHNGKVRIEVFCK